VVTASGIDPAAGTRRARILAHLEQHPDLTAYELAKALSITSSLHGLLHAMEQKGQVAASTEWRQQQGRRVSVWRITAPETVPSPAAVSSEVIDRRRRNRRLSQRRRRARARGAKIPLAGEIPATSGDRDVSRLLPGAACLGADPELFFPSEGDDGAEAKAICAACPVRPECYDLACANGEEAGIWGGEDFGAQSHSEREAEAG
jgi:Transcription factor WhiB/Helix-turn-helix domain